MNIGLSVIGLKKDTGGIYQHSISLIESLLKLKNINLVIFYSDNSLNDEWFFYVDNVENVFVPKLTHEQSIMRRLVLIMKGMFGLSYGVNKYFKEYLIVDKYNCEVIFHTNWNSPILISNTPAVSSIHDCAPYTMPYNLMDIKSRLSMHIMLKMILKKSRHIISESLQGKGEITKFYGVVENKISVINNTPGSYIRDDEDPVEISAVLNKYNISKGYFFLPGRWDGYKNTKRVLDCFEKLYHIDDSVSIVLSGMKEEERKELDLYIQNFNSKSNIYNIGFVDNSEMSSLFQGSVALLFPTLLGPSSLPVYESMKLGRAVIVSNIPEYPNLVKDSGIVVDPYSNEEIYNAMLYVIRNRNSVIEMGKKGKEIIELIEIIQKEDVLSDIISSIMDE